AITMMVPFTIQSILLGLGGSVLLLLIDPLMAAVVVGVVALTSLYPIRLGRPIHERSRNLQDLLGDLSTYIEQQIHGIEVVKGHGSEAVQVREGRALVDRIRHTGIGLTDLRAAFQTSFGVGPSLAAVAVLGLGGWFSLNGRLTAGELFAFIQYLGMLMAPVGVMATVMGLVPQGVAAGERLADVLGTQPEIVSPARPVPLPPGGRGHVRFEGVTFGYRPGEPVLVDLDLDIQPGSSVALVGPSGAGKSTLALLIARFYEPWQGRVMIDDVSVDRVELNELRLAVAMVFEDTVVLNTTVRHNLAMARPTAATVEIVRAAELARADGFIRGLPDGYDTLLGDEGVGLSGGQRQRLSIARAILRDPRVLILDDATSAVDPTTDADIRQSLDEVMRDRTTIIVAHRVETLALADRVLLLDGGGIVADGTHEQLLRHAVYREALALDDAEVAP
ncbi:MAG TPA: ABC transporter ATP-binding protein, partial [Nitriliruptorales bacterium]